MIIRPEKETDYNEIYELVRIAFQTAKVTNGKEQEFVNDLRKGNNYIPELALVLKENDELVGHIMLTKTFIIDNNKKNETLFLGPISIKYEYGKQGYGTKLMNESMNRARKMNYRSIVLVGDPNYYYRFGFKQAIKYGIRHIKDIPIEVVLACELMPNALKGISGTIDI